MQKIPDSDICLASVSLLILLLSFCSAFANLGDTKDEAIKAYGQSSESDKGVSTYHKGDWLIAEAYDARGKCVIASTLNFLEPLMMRMPQLWIRRTFQSMLALTTCRKRSLMFLISGYGPPKIRAWGVVTGRIAFPVVGKLSARAYVLSG